MMLIMTYIPVCSIKYFPIEKPPSFEHSQEESSLRYVVWKLLETYFENLKWDENRGYFSSDHQIGFNLFRVNPFILFLSTIYNYSCMQAVMPLLSLATVHSINELVSSMTVIVEDIALIVRFSCFGVAMSSAHYFLRNEITSRAVFSWCSNEFQKTSLFSTCCLIVFYDLFVWIKRESTNYCKYVPHENLHQNTALLVQLKKKYEKYSTLSCSY